MKAGLLVLMILVFVLGGMKLAGAGPFFDGYREMEGEAVDAFRPDMTVDLLTPNSYSRPETGTSRIRNIDFTIRLIQAPQLSRTGITLRDSKTPT